MLSELPRRQERTQEIFLSGVHFIEKKKIFRGPHGKNACIFQKYIGASLKILEGLGYETSLRSQAAT